MIANSLRSGTIVKLNPSSEFAKRGVLPSNQLPVSTTGRVIKQSANVVSKQWYEVQWVHNGSNYTNSYPIDHLLIIDFNEYIKLL